jgi:excisionase family DNA binding protein
MLLGMTQPSDEILNEQQAADLLKITPRTIRLWRKERGLPHNKITSRVIRYKRSDLEQWLDRFHATNA